MSTFQNALSAWLRSEGNTQTDLGAAIGKSQAAVHRYASGDRFPDATTARAIEQHTNGDVPFHLWQADFLARAGIDPQTPQSEKAA